MSRFEIAAERFGDHDLAVLLDRTRGARLRILDLGATLISWTLPVDGQSRDFLDGFQTPEELESQKSARFAIMAPFANRIADAAYVFDGQRHDLQPGVTGAARGIRHGFVRGVRFSRMVQRADETGAEIEFFTDHIRPGVHAGYPFAIDFKVRYRLDAAGLTLTTTARNVGDRAAPFFFGWHPYFKLADDGIAALELTVPATTTVRVDELLIPLPGEQAFLALDDVAALDYRTPRLIGAAVLDNAYAGLATDADGRQRVHLRDPRSGHRMSLWLESGLAHLFSGDTVLRQPRSSVAIEAMESMTDAFNRDDCAAVIRLEPGAERSYRCGIEISLAEV